ncbi:group II intron maturase-specific domain-containing protein [Virgibacillus alimentarius]|nr:group II intron maturase-specific domain-containing protein [Virgibacillus alimentarius]
MNCRPSRSAKRKFKDKLRKLTSRKRPGTFHEIITKINQTTTGWINYYGISNMKTFIKDIQQWLHHRLRQLIWKRWKLVRTKYRMLRKYGINHDDAMKLANTRKGYWRASLNDIIHRAIPKERLTKWGLKDLSTLYEFGYSRD